MINELKRILITQRGLYFPSTSSGQARLSKTHTLICLPEALEGWRKSDFVNANKRFAGAI